jgi:hypothetical protein
MIILRVLDRASVTGDHGRYRNLRNDTPGRLAPGAVGLPKMTPRARTKLTELSVEVERELRHSIDQADRGETIELTAEELDEGCKTGDLPERVVRWAESRS